MKNLKSKSILVSMFVGIFSSAGQITTRDLTFTELQSEMTAENLVSAPATGRFEGLYPGTIDGCEFEITNASVYFLAISQSGTGSLPTVLVRPTVDAINKLTTDLEEDGGYTKIYELPRGTITHIHSIKERSESWKLEAKSLNGPTKSATCSISRHKQNVTSFTSDFASSAAIVDGQVRYFGERSSTQTPADLEKLSKVTGSRESFCGIGVSGKISCWEDFGGTNEIFEVPNAVISNPFELALGDDHACAIDDRGVVCWGENGYGEIDVPTSVLGATKVAAGSDHSCAITMMGVKCWGDDTWGQQMIPQMTGVREIAANRTRTCAVHDRGVSCWGGDYHTANLKEYPWPHARSLTMSRSQGLCAISDNGIECAELDKIPTPPTDLKNPSLLTMSANAVCALTDTGIRCWGSRTMYVPPDLRDWD